MTAAASIQAPTKTNLLLYLGVTTVSFIFYRHLAALRFIARDEGFYMMAAKLFGAEQLPYFDYFFPQAPLIPFFYGPILQLFGASWEVGRVTSAALTTALTLAVFYVAHKRTGIVGGLVALLLFSTSAFVFPWYLTVQTYALSVTLLFLSYLALVIWRRPLLAGLFFGLTLSSRVMFLVAGLALLIELYRSADLRNRRSFFLLVTGSALGAAPLALFFLLDFELAWFNNFDYHMMRTTLSAADIEKQRQTIINIVFGLRPTFQFHGKQLAALLFINGAYLAWCGIRHQFPDSAVLIAGLLFAINLLPEPTYVQYFCTLMPFLVIGAVIFWYELKLILAEFVGESGRSRQLAKVVPGLLLIIAISWYSWNFPANVRKFTETGKGVIGVGAHNAKSWRMANVDKVSSYLNLHTASGEQVVTSWPGYLIESHAVPVSGLENHFSFNRGVRTHLTPIERRERKVVVMRDLEETISTTPEIRFGVIFNPRKDPIELERILIDSGFVQVKKINAIRIYQRASPPATETRMADQVNGS